MLGQEIAEEIRLCAATVMEKLGAGGIEPPEAEAVQPPSPELGDYSSSIAMKLASKLRKPPMVIAGMIAEELSARGNMEGLIRTAEPAAPGYVNVYLDYREWAAREYILPEAPAGKIIVEHTSINPNKAAHVGHLRNSCIGDTLVRMLKRRGHRVEVHNYIDDLGNQLADTVVGLLHVPAMGHYDAFGDFCWDLYAEVNRAYAKDPDRVRLRADVLHGLEAGTGNEAWLGHLVAERIVKEHTEEMKAFGIHYDLLVWESGIVREGLWDAAFALLKSTAAFVLETEGPLAGCWVLKQPADSSHHGVDPIGGATNTDPGSGHSQDKVIVRSNGILTYTAKDIAYHLWKFGLLDKEFRYQRFGEGMWTTASRGEPMSWGGGDMVINVIDHRQEYPQEMVREAFRNLGYDEQGQRLRHVSYGVVSLSPASASELGIDTSDGKASYAMSGRQGIGIKVGDLLKLMETRIESSRSDKGGLTSREIAAAAIRYYLLRYNLATEVVFDLKQAMETTGNTGVYLMYTHARAVRVLNKASERDAVAAAAGESRREEGINSVKAEAASEAPPSSVYSSKADGLRFMPASPAPAELALLRQLAAWPETLEAAIRELAPAVLCTYAHTLATLFNNFYSVCPILKADEGLQPFRLWLTASSASTLKDVLETLGLPAPERM